ncbi:MAG: xanthine dehydrogenase family protein molybdopterin-binding subunit [Alphaproteobacteria bacterium]|nr:xanthine dehydrogenase family protein molybdopterin-binding subunit [Alphaproteobacteria bacterium]
MTSVVSRRDLLRYTGAFGALVLCSGIIKDARAKDVGSDNAMVGPLVRIAPDGQITIMYPNPDMGQGSATAVPMMLAEELDADFDQVVVEAMPLMIIRRDDGNFAWKVVPQGSGGSTSVPDAWGAIRRLGGIARELLVRAAATRLGVSKDSLRTEKSFVIHGETGQRLTYAELAAAAAEVSLEEGFEPTLKAKADFRLVGTPQKQKAIWDIVTGKPIFGLDATYPGAKVAVVARSPYLDGQVKSVDDSRARQVKGVVDIVVMPRPDTDKFYTYLAAGVAVVADSFWAAKKARDLLDIEWDKGPYTHESTMQFDIDCKAKLANGQGQIPRNDGDVDAAKAGAARTIKRQYRQPFVSHAQLEPQNAIAHVRADRATVIGPFQSPSGVSRITNAITGLDRLSIDVHFTRLGGGFGRRLTSDHAAEAVYLSKATGLPIKVIWTREDDLAHDFYRPAGHHEIVAAFDAGGKLVSWEHRLAGASKYYRRNGVPEEEYWTPDLYPDDFPAGLVPNYRLEYFSMKSGMPRGSWRAPAHTANAFVVQTFLDEVAEEFGRDPLDLRLELLGTDRELKYDGHGGPVFDTGRLKGVLRAVADASGWGRQMPTGRALGIAGHFTFGGYCAQVADVEKLPNGEFRVHKVWVAIDVGVVINPDGLRSQCEGSVNDGLSTALGQEITYEGGVVPGRNFDTYPMMRMTEAPPEIDVIITGSDKAPSGAGEMAIPPAAPAIMNALKRAGGRRVRWLPYRKIGAA